MAEASITERFKENHIVKAILFGSILQLYHLDSPGSCTGPEKDPIKWWKGSEMPPTSCKALGEGDHRSSIMTG